MIGFLTVPIMIASMSYDTGVLYKYLLLSVTNDWRFKGEVITSKSDGMAMRLEDFAYAHALSGERRFLMNPFHRYEPYEIQSNYFSTTITYDINSRLPYYIMWDAVSSAASNLVGTVNEDTRVPSYCQLEGELEPPSDYISQEASENTTFSDICSMFGCTAVTNVTPTIIELATNRVIKFPFFSDDVMSLLSNSSSNYESIAANPVHYDIDDYFLVSIDEHSDINFATNYFPNFIYFNGGGTNNYEGSSVAPYYINDPAVSMNYHRYKSVIKVWDITGYDSGGQPIYVPRDSSVSYGERLVSKYSTSKPSFYAWRMSHTNSPASSTVDSVYGMMFGRAYSRRRTELNDYVSYENDPDESILLSGTIEKNETNDVKFVCTMIFDKTDSQDGKYVILTSGDSFETIAQEVFSSVLSYDTGNKLKPNSISELQDPSPSNHGKGVATQVIRTDDLTLYMEPISIIVFAKIKPETEYRR